MRKAVKVVPAKLPAVLIIALLMTLMALPVFAGGASEPAGDVIRIGIFEPITGAYAAGGAMEVEGIRLANELFPTVEVGGRTYRVELVMEDNKSDKVEAVNAVQRLIDRDKAHLILGSYGSSMSIAAGEIIKGARIPAIGISCTNPLVTAGNDYYFRICFIEPFQGTVMSNYAFNNRKAKNAVIVQEVSSDYSVGLARFFSDNFKLLTRNPNAILTTVNYNTGDRDFTAQLTSIISLNPEIIFAPGNYTESALMIKQARAMGITVPIIGGDTWEAPEFIDLGRESVEGVVFSTFFAAVYTASPVAESFLKEYRARNGGRDPVAVTALGYDGYLVALDAIKRAGSLDPQAIRDAIAKTTGFVGATGTVTLDANGDATKSAFIKSVKGGKFVFETIVNP
ncbi:extracellular ligand-binding receptor [Treponema primitia ZAS-2]|uniref:Extracellular ligand-binding receptor n=1 Tax=Treponema primitia (strain ATCC BAA-887 / DSM 12427 / ZAS-2) TaxID=545694 RepID=F5YMD8_TREPZ|nr:ABC transporter substrate-binding protein [Treponema primitia]AEF86324.1 extracellular ligand-binding receptor [Treponema primitia ZAS-2]